MQLNYSNQSLMSNDRKSYVATICHFLLVLLWIWLTCFSISFGSSADPVGSVLPRHSHSVALCSFYPVVALDSWLETKYQTGFCTFFFPSQSLIRWVSSLALARELVFYIHEYLIFFQSFYGMIFKIDSCWWIAGCKKKYIRLLITWRFNFVLQILAILLGAKCQRSIEWVMRLSVLCL